MRTNVPGVYAIGDVTGKLALAHVASAQGIVAAETIAGTKTQTLDYEAMPRCTYCQPQVASFGLTEAQAVERGHEVKVGRVPLPGQRQGAGPRRAGWLCQDRGRLCSAARSWAPTWSGPR